jgi:hypothetical protein
MLLVYHLDEGKDEVLVASLQSRKGALESFGIYARVLITSGEHYGPHGAIEIVET